MFAFSNNEINNAMFYVQMKYGMSMKLSSVNNKECQMFTEVQ